MVTGHWLDVWRLQRKGLYQPSTCFNVAAVLRMFVFSKCISGSKHLHKFKKTPKPQNILQTVKSNVIFALEGNVRWQGGCQEGHRDLLFHGLLEASREFGTVKS